MNNICTCKVDYQQAIEYANDIMIEKHGVIKEWTKELNKEFTDLVAELMNRTVIVL